MTLSKRNMVLSALLVCISLFVGYAILEVGYRLFERHQLRTKLVNTIMERIPNDGKGDSIFDVHTGYRYRANMEIGPRNMPFPIHYRTNSHGLIAREEFPVEKPAGEFRIGFIGDSFTAGVMSTVRWTDIVEDKLNASDEWRHSVGDRYTRCVNFGLDGIGAMQFGPVAEYLVRPYNVDLLVINMLREDVIRRSYHRGFQTAVSREQIVQYTDSLIAHLPWFGVYPEVLATTIGRYFKMTPRLSYAAVGKAFWGDRLYDNATEAADVSAASIKNILQYFPHVIFLVDPTYKEYTDVRDPLVIAAFDVLAKKMPDVHWVMMIDQLPRPASNAEIDNWFNVPHDQHKNAVGTAIYADAVARYLIDHFSENGAMAH